MDIETQKQLQNMQIRSEKGIEICFYSKQTVRGGGRIGHFFNFNLILSCLNYHVLFTNFRNE